MVSTGVVVACATNGCITAAAAAVRSSTMAAYPGVSVVALIAPIAATVMCEGIPTAWRRGACTRMNPRIDAVANVTQMAPLRPGAGPGGSPVVLSPPSTSGQATPVPTDTPLKRWSTAQLAAATNNFDPARLLGEGGYGEVYRADLPDGTVVAVKRMGADSTEGEAGFLAEVGVTGAVSHPHVLPVLGVVRPAKKRAPACSRGSLLALGAGVAARVETSRRALENKTPPAPATHNDAACTRSWAALRHACRCS